MSPFNPEGERHYRLSPEEEKKHREFEKRKTISEEDAAESAVRSLEGSIRRSVTPEEQERAYRKAVENRENPRM
jgi:hypothetical protein